jgi:uncharacterized protein (TIGR03435 family)
VLARDFKWFLSWPDSSGPGCVTIGLRVSPNQSMGMDSITKLACCGALAWIGCAQDQKPLPSFEVTSVKAGATGGRYVPPACTGGTYIANGQSVASSLWFAYDVQPFRIKGFPDWIRASDALFNIEGKASSTVSESQCRLMVQSLLADRFKLTVHHETRPLSVYALVVGKGGAKVRKADENSTVNQVKVNGVPSFGGEKGWPMSQLADFLARGFPGTPVIDKTGLEGRYAFEFDFTVEPGTPPGDTMAAAVEQKLGLKLESRKEPFDFVVIDRLEKPTGN